MVVGDGLQAIDGQSIRMSRGEFPANLRVRWYISPNTEITEITNNEIKEISDIVNNENRTIKDIENLLSPSWTVTDESDYGRQVGTESGAWVLHQCGGM